MRNPNWHRDEIILALDLYFQLESGEMNSNNPKVIELSGLLNKLPIHNVRPDSVKFRNPNGVNLKLANFKSFDPNYLGKGLKSASKLDKAIFDEFFEDQELLRSIALGIRKTLSNSELTKKLYEIPIEEDEDNGVKEGKVFYKLHKYRERNSKITKKKKDQYFLEKGKLDCEVCGFDFFEVYGEFGKGYIEAHHRVPLSEIEGESKTQLKDLALVCSNCHRMLHRDLSTLSVEKLKSKILIRIQ